MAGWDKCEIEEGSEIVGASTMTPLQPQRNNHAPSEEQLG